MGTRFKRTELEARTALIDQRFSANDLYTTGYLGDREKSAKVTIVEDGLYEEVGVWCDRFFFLRFNILFKKRI